jgi:nitric oxide reductase NorQ protein
MAKTTRTFHAALDEELTATGTVYLNSKANLDAYPDAFDAIYATVMQMSYPSATAELRPLMTESSVVRGRAVKRVVGILTELEETEEFYPRPNGQNYYTRKWGDYGDVAVLRAARTKGHHAFIKGAPGCGKTALVEAAFGPELVTLVGSGDTVLEDFLGSYVPTGVPGEYVWYDGPLIKAAEQGLPFFVDEIGLIDTKVLAGLYGLMDGRGEITNTMNPSKGTIKAAPGFFVISATNPHAPGVRLSEALTSRFTLQVEMTTDWELALKLGVPEKFVTVATNLDRKRQAGGVSWGPQFRELLAARDLAKDYGTAFAVRNMMQMAPEQELDIISEVVTAVFSKEFVAAYI